MLPAPQEVELPMRSSKSILFVLALVFVFAAIPAFVLARSETAERERALPAGVMAEAAA